MRKFITSYFVVLSLFALSACRDDQTNPLFSSPVATGAAIDSTKLFIVTLEGTEGVLTILNDSAEDSLFIPEDTTLVFGRGAVLTYAFFPKNGYQNTDVVLNDSLASDSASVSTQLSGAIFATSERVFNLPVDAQPLLSKWQNLRTRTDSVYAYREILSLRRNLANTYGDSLSAFFNEYAMYKALTPYGVDSTLFYIRALPDSTYKISSPVSNVTYNRMNNVVNMSSGGVASQREAVVINVNGITLDETDLEEESAKTKSGFESMNSSLENGAFESFYNPTAYYETSNADLSSRLCYYHMRASSVLGLSKWKIWESAHQLMCGVPLDLLEAGTQVAKRLAGVNLSPVPASNRLADRLEGYLDQRKKILIIGESQGTLITWEALKALQQRRPTNFNETAGCIGVVAVAAPYTNYPAMGYSQGSELFSYSTVKGQLTEDIIYRLGLNSHAGFPTGKSNRYDDELRRITQAGGAFAGFVKQYKKFFFDVDLHMFLRSYYRGVAMDSIAAQGARHMQQVESTCFFPQALSVTPDTLKLVVAQQKQLNIQVHDDLGRNIPNYTVSFTQPNSNIVTFYSGTNYVLGKGVGSTTMTFSATINGVVQTKTVHIVVGEPTVQITPTTIPKLTIGYTHVTLTAKVFDADGQEIPTPPISWTRQNTNVGLANPHSYSTLVQAWEAGGSYVYAYYPYGGKDSVFVPTERATVQINPATVPKLTVGYTHVTLTAKVFDANGQEIATPAVQWARQNSNVGLANPYSYSTVVNAWEAGGSYVHVYGWHGERDSVFVPTERPTLEINPATVPKLTVGYGSTTLTARVFDANGLEISTPSVQWARQNSNVGFSNQYSYTTAVSAGGAGGSYVHAYGQHGGQDSVFVSTATATVQIIPSTVPTLTVGTSSNSVIFTAKVFDANGQEIPTPPVQWARQNTNISFNNQYSATTSVIAQAPGGSYAHAYYAYGGQDSVYVPTQAH